MKDKLLIAHQKTKGTCNFWAEENIQELISMVERNYRTEILMKWCVLDVIIKGDKILINWQKRVLPLTKEQAEEKYYRGKWYAQV